MGRNVTRNNQITHRLRHLSLFDVIIGTRAAEIGGDCCKRREQQQAHRVSHLGGGKKSDNLDPRKMIRFIPDFSGRPRHFLLDRAIAVLVCMFVSLSMVA